MHPLHRRGEHSFLSADRARVPYPRWMAYPVVDTPRLRAAMKKIRPVALAIPGVVEKVSHGTPTFFTSDKTSGRTFTSVHDERGWSEGRLCLWYAAPKDLQEAVVGGDPAHYFVPPYVGVRGWIGLRLDLPDTDWDAVAGAVEDAHEFISGR